MAGAQGVSVGDKAPGFTVNEVSGRVWSLRDMRSQGSPLFLYFINDRDNLSSRASSYINRMVRAYTPSHVKWYGIINAREDRTRSYVTEFNPPYQVLMDRNMTAVQLYGLQNAPAVIMIDRQGRVAKIWRGFSGPMLKDLNRTLARVNGKRVKRLDFSRTPSVTQYGQPFIRARAGAG
jgi:peroxiredoxin